ncbi:MAG: ubiquinol-cytochrome c reductase iron-sulfur subunit [Chloroflexi bacterium]|nr:ubiquinol-cytochrome c reductase iron-sulfur subunit [Chloroflexota bacterium]
MRPPSSQTAAPREQERGALTRRGFVASATNGLLALSGLLGLAGLWRFLSFRPDPPAPAEFDLGPASGYPPNSRTPLPQARAVLLHTPDGFLALSTICPHLGCTVEPSAGGFACPCHGSRFDAPGRLLRGPATRSLSALRLEQTDDGRLILHTAYQDPEGLRDPQGLKPGFPVPFLAPPAYNSAHSITRHRSHPCTKPN